MEYTEKVIEKIKDYCMSLPGVYETRPFGEYPICYRIMGKIFAQLNPQEDFYKITLKCNPDRAYAYRELYPGVVVRGYHCPPVQQPYWNTIDLDAFDSWDALCTMIDEAYAEIEQKFTKKMKSQFAHQTKLEFKITDGDNKDFIMLCGCLDNTLNEMIGQKAMKNDYNKLNVRDKIHDVIIVYADGKPIGCGSFKAYDEEHAEIKRVYTDPEYRGFGLGKEIVRRVEAQAKIKGYRYCILESGRPLEAAHHTYQSLGYKIIDNYGPYVNMDNSICMQRKI